MKPYIYIAGLSCLSLASVNANAQEEDSKDKITTPKFVTGLNAGISSLGNFSYYTNKGNFAIAAPATTAGVFGRYYMGQHLALETGFDISYFSLYYSNLMRIHKFSYGAPVNFQYHLLKAGAKLRPYFGAGFGYRQNIMTVKEYSSPEILRNTYQNTSAEIYFQFTQGITYQINKHWQFNESISIQRGKDKSYGLKLGIGYTFR